MVRCSMRMVHTYSRDMNTSSLWHNDKLFADSEVYKAESEVYELFSQAEDYPNLISTFLLPLIQDKTVLDVGCGTGRYIPALAPASQRYYGIEISETQLAIAKSKGDMFQNTELILASADKLPLEDRSIDIAFATWVIGSIHDLELRKAVIAETLRVLSKDGSLYLIENDIGGEFKHIIEEGFGAKKTAGKSAWLEAEGFKKVSSFETYFQFDSIESARHVFESIWDKEIAAKILQPKISHNIVIYTYDNR